VEILNYSDGGMTAHPAANWHQTPQARALIAELAQIIAPFVNADGKSLKADLLVPIKGEAGIWMRRRGIDIAWGVTRTLDADVRSVSEAGIEYFHYSGNHLIPWNEIREIVLFTRGADGNRASSQVIPVASYDAALDAFRARMGEAA
jgi:hypothetical protein